MPRTVSLEKLLKDKAALESTIAEAKRKKAKEAAEVLANRCRIIGAAIIAELKENQAFAAVVDPVIQARVIAPRERLALGLPPLEKKLPPADAGEVEQPKNERA